MKVQTDKPFNVNFFCHVPPVADAAREAAWRTALAPYYKQYGIDPAGIPAGPGRAPFSAEFADVLEEYQPAVVSFHFGLPAARLLARVASWRSKIFCSATTVEEALWLEAHGVDARFHLELPDVVTAPRHELFHAINPRRSLDRLEIDVAVENLVRQAQHPGAPLADLAVRDCRQVAPERSAESPHHVFDRLERNTTYQQQFLTHSSTRLCDRI